MDSTVLDPSVSRRWRVDDHGSEFVITIPRSFSWATFVALPVLIGLIYAFSDVFSAVFKVRDTSFIIIALILIGMLKDWLRNLGGTDVVTFANQNVAIRRELFGIPWTRNTPFKEIDGFTFESKVEGEHGHPSRIVLVRKTPSNVGLPIPFSKIRFAKGVTRQEGDEIMDAIEKRFPDFLKLTPDD